MKNKLYSGTTLLITAIVILFTSTTLGQSGSLQGKVVDKLTGEKLVGANVLVVGTVIGAATNIDGEFKITGIPVGKRIIKISYIGYKSTELEIEFLADKIVEQKFELELDVIKGEEVIVTAQLLGQASAINQQINSNTIVNIVSKDKLQELPDQNAAETLSRLPGISLQRDAGEGSKVVIRGLSPKFNLIKINGEQIPSTDNLDRSVDLSMISPEMLEGIEVYKALTPDQDADAIGGTVNFVIKKAPDAALASLKAQGGFNKHAESFKEYKISGSLSDRFLDNRLGVLITGNAESKNRGSHQLSAGYDFKGQETSDLSTAIIGTSNLNIGDKIETRKRYGFSLAADYDLDINSNIMFNTFWSNTDRDEVRRRKRYRVGTNRIEYDLRESDINIQVWTNTLSGKHEFFGFNIDWRAAYSQTMNDVPYEHFPIFREEAAFNANLVDDKGPELIPLGAKNDISDTFFKWDYLNSRKSEDKNITGQIDIKYPLNITEDISAYLKIGGKHKSKNRTFEDNQEYTAHFNFVDLGREMSQNPEYFRQNYMLTTLSQSGAVGFADFIDPSYNAEDFLNGAYVMNMGINLSFVNKFFNVFRNYVFPSGAKLWRDFPLSNLNDYDASENVTSAYLMGEINLGPQITLLGGARYEKTQNDYESIFGTPVINDDGESVSGVKDTSGVRSYDSWLPMVHLKYKPTDWMDIRLAATKSLSRPNFFNLVPKEIINGEDKSIEIGDPNLKPTSVWNYDVFLSFYNRLGLFTIGAFYKELRDIDYERRFPKLENRADPYYGWVVEGPINSKELSIVKGLEAEIQTNLRWLPSPFDGIVLYLNFSRIFSKTYYPVFTVVTELLPVPPFVRSTAIDTVREGQVVGQADYIGNLAIGYEKGGFSGRLSMVMQGRTLDFVAEREEFDGFIEAFTRWDLVLSQKLLSNLTFFLNLNNFSNTPEKALLGFRDYSTRQEFFDWTLEFGVKYNL